MKRKLVYFLYSGYIVFLVGLLGSRFANSISKGTLNIICLFIFIGVLAFVVVVLLVIQLVKLIQNRPSKIS